MINANQVRTIAAQAKIDPGIIEKDYMLSKVLMALAQNESFIGNLLFKGGTALKKCYYPDWRFSEDLDFTSKSKLEPKVIKAIFEEAVKEARNLFGLNIRVLEYSQYPRTGNDLVSAQLKLGYDGPLQKSSGQKNNVRVDIALEEELVSEPVRKTLTIRYTDDIEAVLPVYSLEEIVAEKLRSILQRGKSRDYYDVWILLRNHSSDFSASRTYEIFKAKCLYKNIREPKIDEFFHTERVEEAQRYWERGLAHQLSGLVAFEEVRKELKDLLNKIFA